MLVTSAIPFYLILVNVYVFGLMAYDKRQAIEKGSRIPEWNMMFMGAIGGGLGGLIARQVFHHKTTKKRFAVLFGIGIVVDLFLLYLLLRAK